MAKYLSYYEDATGDETNPTTSRTRAYLTRQTERAIRSSFDNQETEIRRIPSRISTNTIETVIEDVPATVENTSTDERILNQTTNLTKLARREKAQLINERYKLLRQSYPQTTAKRVATRVVNGIQRGDSIEVVNERINKALQPTYQSRAGVIGRTETTNISNEYTLRSMENGGVRKKRWITRDDTRVRASHRRVHRTTRLIGNTWTIHEPQGTRKYKRPGPPGCRCRIVPVVRERKRRRRG